MADATVRTLITGTAAAETIRAGGLVAFDWVPEAGDTAAEVWAEGYHEWSYRHYDWLLPSAASGQVVFDGVSAAAPFQAAAATLRFTFDGGLTVDESSITRGGPWSWSPTGLTLDPGTLQGAATLQLGTPQETAAEVSWTFQAGTVSVAAYRSDGNSGFDGQGSRAGGHWALHAAPLPAEVLAGAGDDTLEGGGASDRLLGEAGDDELLGLGDGDRLYGGDGGDRLEGGDGADTLDGQRGNDLLLGGDGNDVGSGGSGADTLRGGAGWDVLFGHAGDDVLEGGQGSDRLIGGADGLRGWGFDTVSYAASAAAVSVDLGAGTARGGDAEGDHLLFIAALEGSGFADRLAGDAAGNRLGGGSGNDTLAGARGDDTLVGGLGSDVIEGGEGNDVAVFAGLRTGYAVTLSEDGRRAWVRDIDAADGREGIDALVDVERLRFADAEVAVTPAPRAAARWVFTADDGIAGTALWTTNGTAGGTRLVTELPPTPGNLAPPGQIRPLGDGRVTFIDLSGGRVAYWVTDGTTSGTHALTQGGAAADGAVAPPALGHGASLVALDDGVHGNELWVTDGTDGGTHLVADLHPGSRGSYPASFALLAGGQAVFAAGGSAEVWGGELWASDGTGSGTRLLRSIAPDTYSYGLWEITAADQGRYAVFRAEGPRGAYYADSVWATDGTAGGTLLLHRFDRAQAGDAASGFVALDNGTVLFTAGDGVHGRELWRTDGTAAGTRMVQDVLPGAAGSDPAVLADLGHGRALLSAGSAAAAQGTGNRELWITDGTAAGTHPVQEILPGPRGSDPGQGCGMGNGRFVFAATGADAGGFHGRELWVTDGTAAGTRMVRDIWPGGGSSQDSLAGGSSAPEGFVAAGEGHALFLADDGVHGRELWVTDGTADGTRMVADIDGLPGSGSDPANLTPVW